MSGGAKLYMINSCLAVQTTTVTLSAMLATLILGCLSYVMTLGKSIGCSSSFSNFFSMPPYEKNVTCSYFSVSAIQTDGSDPEPEAMKTLTGDVSLLYLVLGEPFGQHLCHRLRRVGHWEWETGIVARQGSFLLRVHMSEVFQILKTTNVRYEVYGQLYVDRLFQQAKDGGESAISRIWAGRYLNRNSVSLSVRT